MAPSGEGLAVFEPGLAIADLFTRHFYDHMPIILLVRKAPLRVSRQGFEFLKDMQREGRQEDMVVLFLAPSALDVFTGEEPGLSLQINIFHSPCINSPIRHSVPRLIQSASCVSFFSGRMPSYFWQAVRAL